MSGLATTASARAPTCKGLILCADDFAVHASASQGIAQLAAQGRLSATSAMVLSPRWAHDVALLRDVRGRIDVGLHLDWTSSFARQHGHGLSLPRAMWRSLWGGFDPVAARTVIEHQLDAFEAQWQAPPDFVDGHQHVQQFAGIRQALVAALQQRYGAQKVRPYLRLSRPPASAAAAADLKSRVIAALGARPLEALARQAQLPTAPALLGIYDFSGDAARYAQRMRAWLHAAPAGGLLMCHPARALPDGQVPGTTEAADTIAAARTCEWAYLGSAAFAADLADAGVTLVRGQEVLSPSGISL